MLSRVYRDNCSSALNRRLAARDPFSTVEYHNHLSLTRAINSSARLPYAEAAAPVLRRDAGMTLWLANDQMPV